MRIQLPSSMPFTVETRIAPRGMQRRRAAHDVAHAVARDRADHELAVGERLREIGGGAHARGNLDVVEVFGVAVLAVDRVRESRDRAPRA